jgi:hypothetical protein
MSFHSAPEVQGEMNRQYRRTQSEGRHKPMLESAKGCRIWRLGMRANERSARKSGPLNPLGIPELRAETPETLPNGEALGLFSEAAESNPPDAWLKLHGALDRRPRNL